MLRDESHCLGHLGNYTSIIIEFHNIVQSVGCIIPNFILYNIAPYIQGHYFAAEMEGWAPSCDPGISDADCSLTGSSPGADAGIRRIHLLFSFTRESNGQSATCNKTYVIFPILLRIPLRPGCKSHDPKGRGLAYMIILLPPHAL